MVGTKSLSIKLINARIGGAMVHSQYGHFLQSPGREMSLNSVYAVNSIFSRFVL